MANERNAVLVGTTEEGTAVIDMPITRVNNVEGMGRIMGATYYSGDIVYADTNNAIALICTTGGVTSSKEIDFSGVVVGGTVKDGGVVWLAIARGYTIATQAEAEAGADNTKAMTPLRTKEAFDKNFSDRKLEEATERIENIYAPVDDGFIGMKIEGGGTIFFDYMLGYKYGSLAVAPVTSNLHSYHIDKDRNIVVCDDPNDTTKQHRFYVVSDYDIGDYKHGENLMWADTASASMYNILVGTETGFGKGYSNTEKCIAAASADNRLEWNANAYNMIWHYVWKGDWQYRSPKWFVPSKDELNVLLNMQWHEAARRVSYDGTVKMKQLPINFYSYYWSSSESSATVAHSADFFSGGMGADGKYSAIENHVRLCRTF